MAKRAAMMINEFPLIKDVSAKIEDVDIYFYEIAIQLSRITPEENVLKLAYTNIAHNLEVHYYERGRELVGGVIIHFMSQGEEKGLMLTFISTMSANSKVDNESASIVNKTIQYIFDWVSNFIKENEIKDKYDELFTIPLFHYSKEQFKLNFPD